MYLELQGWEMTAVDVVEMVWFRPLVHGGRFDRTRELRGISKGKLFKRKRDFMVNV